mgnify:CR=1 FL=1
MYRKVEDFLEDWREESAATLKMFSHIEDARMDDKASDNVRTLNRLAWHIIQTITEMGTKAGLFTSDELEHRTLPELVEHLTTTYKEHADKLGESVKNNWVDASLPELLPMYGENWAKGKILSILVRHQTHHRGQMTVLLRLQGLPVHGVYGPAKEEWAQFGMPTLE